jgi:poly(3-hydroxybutyrate) depolymerase
VTVRHVSLVVLCVAVLGCGSGSAADTIFGRGGEVQWIDVPDGRLKTEVYSSTPLSARPVLVIVLHGDLFNPTPS